MEKQDELKDEERQPCEIWTRVMGYYRPVSEFNAGKKAEFQDRMYFTYESGRAKPSDKDEAYFGEISPETINLYNTVKQFIDRRCKLKSSFLGFITRSRKEKWRQTYEVEIRMQKRGFAGRGLTELIALKRAFRVIRIYYKNYQPEQIDIEDILKSNKRKEN